MIPNFRISKEKLYRLNIVFNIIKQYTKAGINLSKKYIDLGCKDGYLLDKARELDYDVYGIDISDNIVKVLSEQGFNMKKHDLGKSLPYHDYYFDIVTCLQVIEHLTNPEHLVKEMYRILKPGGILILSTPNLASLGSRLRLLVGLYPLQLGPCNKWHFGNHYRLFTLPTLKTVLKRNKFSIDKVIGTEVYFNPNSWKSGWHTKLGGKMFPSLAQRIIVVCKK